MNVRILSIISLVMLSLSGISSAQQDVNRPAGASAPPIQLPPSPMSTGGRGGRGGFRQNSVQPDAINRIFHLQHAQAEDMSRTIVSVFGGMPLAVDGRTNSIILSASSERLEQVSRLIQELDVVREPESSLGRSMMCRVYMVEVLPERPELKPFTMVLGLRAPAFPNAQVTMKAIKDLQVDKIDSIPGEVTVIGRAASNDTLSRMVDTIPDTVLKKLDWDPNGQGEAAPAAIQAPPLNARVAETVLSLLGGRTQTVGYWFGNVSVSGMLSAPLNSQWRLNWSAKSEKENELWLSISVVAVNSGQPEILSNMIDATVGKPIIIGYSRGSGGSTVTGAMIILLESEPKPKS